jgi:serine/threonine protein kinase/formylglycine-generating enzyme required for sulfatase activity
MTERDIFLAAIELPDLAERAAYIEKVCAGDATLRGRVEGLLRSHDIAGSFLGMPAAALPDPARAGAMKFDPAAVPDTNLTSDGVPHPDGDDELRSILAPATRPDSLGRIGHYEVLEVLGRGGFGIVFRAFDDVLHRVVAVKMMTPQMAATSPARKRFLREARTSAAVRHENVVQVHEVGELPLPYLVMEFIPGETLQQRLDRSGPLDVAEVLRIGRQIAEGLAAAHASDLIHRDVKPGNILLESGAQKVKITDFGLARAADDASMTQSGMIAGTPMYMAPEQALGHTLDQRADLFSLGSVLYQMVTGRPPFRANNTLAVLKRVSEDSPRPIRETIPETPRWLCDIIAKLHEKNPDDRFQSAREVADVLADCEAQLKEHDSIIDFSRIPKSKHSRQRSAWEQFAWVSALSGLAAAFLMIAPFGLRFLRNKSVVEVMPSGGLVGVMVHQDGEAITDWFDSRKQTKIDLRPGTYRLEASFAPGRTLERWEITTHGLVSTNTAWQLKRACEIEVSRGDRVVVRAVMRDDPSTLPDPPKSGPSGWVPLFNGKNLKGWNTSNPNSWKVENDTLVGTTQDFKFNYLNSDRNNYENFHLRTEVKINGEGDSGIYFRNAHETTGYEAQINSSQNNQPKTGSLALRTKRDMGEQWQWLHTISKPPVPPDTWFTYEIIAKGSEIAILINGIEMSRSIDETNLRGGISLELGKAGTVVHFRKLEIKEFARSNTTQKPLPPTYKNSIGMEFAIVPKGKSWLGGGKDKLGDNEVEIPSDFYLGKHLVTQEEWTQVMGENPSHFSRTGGGMDAVKDIDDADLKRFPVEMVSWDQCQLFVAKLNKMEKETGWVYRLPTEVEWEYACRGGPMPVGDKLDSAFDFYFAKPTNTLLPEQANYEHGNGLKRTCKVGSYEPNMLGLYDMHGNVWEWCDDTEKAPNGALLRVYRGGCWFNDSVYCGAANRDARTPSVRGNNLGLRLARVPSVQEGK